MVLLRDVAVDVSFALSNCGPGELFRSTSCCPEVEVPAYHFKISDSSLQNASEVFNGKSCDLRSFQLFLIVKPGSRRLEYFSKLEPSRKPQMVTTFYLVTSLCARRREECETLEHTETEGLLLANPMTSHGLTMVVCSIEITAGDDKCLSRHNPVRFQICGFRVRAERKPQAASGKILR